MTVAFNKFNCLTQDIATKKHDLSADSLMCMFTNVAPVATNAVKGDITELAGGNGYAAGGNNAPITSCAQTGGVLKLVLGNPTTWTASGGAIGPFRYVVLYNNTATSKNLIGYYDYGSAVTVNSGEQFQVAFDATNGALTIT